MQETSGSSSSSSGSGSSGKPTDPHAPGVKTMQDLQSYPRAFVLKRLLAFIGIVIGCEHCLQSSRGRPSLFRAVGFRMPASFHVHTPNVC